VHNCFSLGGNWRGGERDLHVEEDISVWVVDVVSEALLVISNHVQAPGVQDFVQILNDLLALRTGNGGLDNWACGLIWEEGSFARWLRGLHCCDCGVASLWSEGGFGGDDASSNWTQSHSSSKGSHVEGGKRVC
jgi:hypothetical protein